MYIYIHMLQMIWLIHFILFNVVSSKDRGRLKTCLPRLAPQQAPQQAPAAAKHDAGGRLRRGAWPG